MLQKIVSRIIVLNKYKEECWCVEQERTKNMLLLFFFPR